MRVLEKKWNSTFNYEVAKNLRQAIDKRDFRAVKEEIVNSYREISRIYPTMFDEHDVEEMEDVINYVDEFDEEELQYQIDSLFDLADSLNIWIPTLNPEDEVEETDFSYDEEDDEPFYGFEDEEEEIDFDDDIDENLDIKTEQVIKEDYTRDIPDDLIQDAFEEIKSIVGSKTVMEIAEGILTDEQKKYITLHLCERYEVSLELLDESLVEAKQPKIEVENPGMLEVPEGKKVNELPLSHFEQLVTKKGYDKVIKALNNLAVWNKNDDKSLSKWAEDTMEKLKEKQPKTEDMKEVQDFGKDGDLEDDEEIIIPENYVHQSNSDNPVVTPAEPMNEEVSSNVVQDDLATIMSADQYDDEL